MHEAGVQQASVSIDGLEPTHDYLRGKPGAWRSCFQTIEHLRSADIAATCNSQINRLTAPELPLLYELLRESGVTAWQLQLTVPMGNAADNAWLLLQPAELLDVFPVLAAVAKRARADGILLFAGNNIGYHGPYERLLRGGGAGAVWSGCQAGLSTLGLEADGTRKGCPSLPTAAYSGGNIRERSIAEIVCRSPELNFNRTSGTATDRAELWGFCSGCEHAATCRGGCSWTAHTIFGRRGNNPYCQPPRARPAQQGNPRTPRANPTGPGQTVRPRHLQARGGTGRPTLAVGRRAAFQRGRREMAAVMATPAVSAAVDTGNRGA
jgi:radical SAM protein with 4Fe4S-binding SPASM domain